MTQADRERAWPYRPSCYKDQADTKARWMDGCYDRAAPVIQAFARHRIASTEALADLLAELRDWAARHANGLMWRFADQEIAKKVDAALASVKTEVRS